MKGEGVIGFRPSLMECDFGVDVLVAALVEVPTSELEPVEDSKLAELCSICLRFLYLFLFLAMM